MAKDGFSHLDSRREVRSAALGRQPLGPDSYPVPKVLAEVLDYNSDTETYSLMSIGSSGRTDAAGEERMDGVPRKVHSPGEAVPLATGTTVVVDLTLGIPYIDGVLAVDATRDAVDGDPTLPKIGDVGSELSGLPGYSGDADDDYWRRAGIAKNLLADEWAQFSPDGNYLAVLRGKFTAIYGSAKAQIMMLGAQDLIKMISEDYEHIHALGFTKIVNENGRNSLTFRGGSDQKTQSGGSEENWNIEFDLGAKGDLFDFRILSSERDVVARIHISAEGKITWQANKGIDLVNPGGGTQKKEVGGDDVEKIGGSQRKFIEQNEEKTIKGAYTTKVSETKKQVIGTDDSKVVNRNKLTSVGGTYEQTITGGDAMYATPLNVAVKKQVLNGSYNLEIGNPIIASKKARPGYNLFVYNGNITMGGNPDPSPLTPPTILSTFSINTNKPGSIGLGGTAPTSLQPFPCILHGMLFEPYNALINALITYIDTHTHPLAGAATGIPAVPSAPILSPLISPCMSTIVTMGG